MKRKGICMVCACTQEDACDEGCDWANVKKTLCTVCVDLSPEERLVKQATNLAELEAAEGMLEETLEEVRLRMQIIRANAKPLKPVTSKAARSRK